MRKIVGRMLAGLLGLVVVILAAAYGYERFNRSRDAARYPPPGRMVDVGGGRRLHIHCLGEGAPTVVLETGGGVTSLLQYPLQTRIAAFTRVCAYDRANMGWSDEAPSGRAFSDYAADLHRLLANAGEKGPYVLVGESWGGLLIRAYAQAYPQEVAGLVLVDAGEEQIARDVLLPNARRLLGAARLTAVAAELGLVRRGVPRAPQLSPGLSTGQRTQLGALMSRPSQWREATNTSALERMPADGYGSLGELPLVVIRHGRPFVGPMAAAEPGWAAAQARLAALSTDSTMIVATGNGHTIAEENPDLVAGAVRDLLGRLHKAVATGSHGDS